MEQQSFTLQSLLDASWLLQWLPLALVLGLYFAIRLANKVWAERLKKNGLYSHYRQQGISLILVTLLVLMVIVAAPMESELQGQLLSLFGIIISAAIALSSTTLMGNLMAGGMLRVVNSFKLGDFVRVDGLLGKVSDISLLHVEVQTEDSDLKIIPNLVLVQRPFTVIHAEGTVIHCEVSLGYDVQRSRVESALLKAVKETGLSDGYVQMRELGDFSITYSLHARLDDVGKIVSTKSRLNANMVDALHEASIEIVSPSYMNQRVITHAGPVTAGVPAVDSGNDNNVESILFEKADQAELAARLEKRLASIQKRVHQIGKELEEASEEDREEVDLKLASWRRREAQVQFLLDEARDKVSAKK